MRVFALAAVAGLTLIATALEANAQDSGSWRAGQEFDDCSGAGWCPRMVVVAGGSFVMGSPDTENGRDHDEGPQRRVDIAQFAVGKFEITFNEWDACVNRGGCGGYWIYDAGMGRGRRPVNYISWDDARAYVLWLSRETRRNYRLLSEAEWEYAARAGANTPYPWGSAASHNYANYGTDECCAGVGVGRDEWVNHAPVGQFPANAFGLHDMHGNIWEWVQDCYAPYAAAVAATGDGQAACANRVNRGGSWFSTPQSIRSAYRGWDVPNLRSISVGFRIARTLD